MKSDIQDSTPGPAQVKTIADEARRQGRGYLVFSPFGLILGIILSKPALIFIFATWIVACPLLLKRKRLGIVLFLLPFLFVLGQFLWLIVAVGPSTLRICFALAMFVFLWVHQSTFGPVLWGNGDWDDLIG